MATPDPIAKKLSRYISDLSTITINYEGKLNSNQSVILNEYLKSPSIKGKETNIKTDEAYNILSFGGGENCLSFIHHNLEIPLNIDNIPWNIPNLVEEVKEIDNTIVMPISNSHQADLPLIA